MPTGVLLLNVGSPDSPATGDVRRYLREFLGDPRVLDLPAAGRWALLNLIILPFRPRRSARAYRAVWTERGSPLAAHSGDFARGLGEALGPDFMVVQAMRYGRPSVREACAELVARNVKSITVFPLYPQYASSSTGTALEATFRQLGREWNVPPIRVVAPFYAEAGFLAAFAAAGREALAESPDAHVLFSYHGLPERHVRKSECRTGHCLRPDYACCAAMEAGNRYCYRAQCAETTRRLAALIGLAPDRHSLSFQSRLGRTPWIGPYTDHVIPELARRGVRDLVVLCPSFVADCLETVEEMGLRGREAFLAAGGASFRLVPSLNARPDWIRAAVDLVRSS